ncbi:hypothetical protein EDB19DRAFT_1827612 [Suillus lakei]|nr:hypothetical protein EDB19DRAFT_1827612 [Suillus lakei]
MNGEFDASGRRLVAVFQVETLARGVGSVGYVYAGLGQCSGIVNYLGQARASSLNNNDVIGNTDNSTCTMSSSSSSYANTTSTSSSSSSHKQLSTGARVGLGFGIVLFSYLKRRYQRAREKVDHEPALSTSEANQYLPPQSIASGGRDPPPPPRLDAAHPASVAADPQRIATQDVHTLQNPHYPFSASARPSSYYSPTYSIPYDASASATMMATLNAPVASSSSNSQSEHQLSVLHADTTRHQKEFELEHRKRSLDEVQEPQDPLPKYSF